MFYLYCAIFYSAYQWENLRVLAKVTACKTGTNVLCAKNLKTYL